MTELKISLKKKTKNTNKQKKKPTWTTDNTFLLNVLLFKMTKEL